MLRENRHLKSQYCPNCLAERLCGGSARFKGHESINKRFTVNNGSHTCVTGVTATPTHFDKALTTRFDRTLQLKYTYSSQ
jgi:hypothetical protein